MTNEIVTWDSTKPAVFNYTVEYTATTYKDYGAGVIIPNSGIAVVIVGLKTKCFFHIHPIGISSLYYCQAGTIIHLSKYKIPLQLKFPKVKVEQVLEGIIYVFNGVLKRYNGFKIIQPKTISTKTEKQLIASLKESAVDMYKKLGSPDKVATTISGGTDGILTACILKEVGIKQKCYCVGNSTEDFDPKLALEYAKHIGLDYEYIQLPQDDISLQGLLERTLLVIEQTDFSNVLMGMCNTLVREKANEQGIYTHFNSDYADVILGNDMLTVGAYRKSRSSVGVPETAESWAQWRLESGLHSLPTNIMIDKVFSYAGNIVRQLFYHPYMVDFLLSSSLESTPASRDKVLYKKALNTLYPNAPWDFKKKIGFYTGAGIGKIRLKNEILADENIRETFKIIRGK